MIMGERISYLPDSVQYFTLSFLKDALHNPADRRQYDSGRGMLKGVT